MHKNPIDIEKLYNETRRYLTYAGSERVQLYSIHRFLQSIHPDFSEYDSYLIQLFEEFPVLDHPLLFTGLRPEYLQNIVELCEQAAQEIEELSINDPIHRKIGHLKTGLSWLYSWLNISENEVQIVRTLSNTRQELVFKQLFGTVFIPAIELNDNTKEKTGRLRKLSVEIIGESSSGRHELKPVFGVIGANIGNLGDRPAKAAGNLLAEIKKHHKTWIGSATFELSHIWHAGHSANLALAGLFYCEILKAEKMREYFSLNPGIAVTGDIDETGKVLPVDGKTLIQKVEAAFFSWVQTLVVPHEQLSEVASYIENLNDHYPNRQLAVAGIGSLKELFFDRRLSLYLRTSLMVHTAIRVWDKKIVITSITALLIMAIVLAMFMIGPIDKNPVLADFEGEIMMVKNRNGKTVYSENVGTAAVKRAENEVYDVITFVDVNGDGMNEVLKLEFGSNSNIESALHLLNSDFKDTLWTNNLDFIIPYVSHPNLGPDQYLFDKMTVADLDRDGKQELIASLSHATYFPSFLGIFNMQTGELERYYTNPGSISGQEIVDLDNDGFEEIIVALELKSHRMRAIAILPHDFRTGHGRLGLRYQSSLSETIEKAIIAFPMSIVGKTIYNEAGELWRTGNMLLNKMDSNSKTLHVNYYEVSRADHPEFVDLLLVYTFDRRLNIINVGSSDNYDIIGEQLFTEDKIPLLPDNRYLESLRDSLLYWDGSQFVSHSTLNKKFLELVGEDSSYYNEYYFYMEEE